MKEEQLKTVIELTERTLLSGLKLDSIHSGDPVRVLDTPSSWDLLGAGNYAAVFTHNQYQDIAVKVYAPGRKGWEKEKEVYHRLGDHPSYSVCYYADICDGSPYLILRRLRGKTLYQCLLEGILIPADAITDIDHALEFARERGLNPHDVHGKNVMVSSDGNGLVLDVSDFMEEEPCVMWDDLKKAYSGIYKPFLSKYPLPVPEWMMDGLRKGYRLIR